MYALRRILVLLCIRDVVELALEPFHLVVLRRREDLRMQVGFIRGLVPKVGDRQAAAEHVVAADLQLRLMLCRQKLSLIVSR